MVSVCRGRVTFVGQRPARRDAGPDGLPPSGRYQLVATSVKATDRYSFGYTVAPAARHGSDQSAQPLTVTVRNNDTVLGTGLILGDGHGTFTWDTSALPTQYADASVMVTSAGGATSQLARQRAYVDHGQQVSVQGIPTASVSYGWTGPLSLRVQFGTPGFGAPQGCGTLMLLDDSMYPAQLTAPVDGGAAQTEEELPFLSWQRLIEPRCWILDHDLSRLVGALHVGHHTVSISETGNRGVHLGRCTVLARRHPSSGNPARERPHGRRRRWPPVRDRTIDLGGPDRVGPGDLCVPAGRQHVVPDHRCPHR